MRNNQINNSFAERPAKRILSTILPWLLFTGLTLALSGCGDSPQATINPDGSGGVDTGVYKGPGPASPDVQSFKNEFWEPLRATNRCGSCHNTTQSPMFVNTGDINVAYDFATSVVDVTNPSNSLIVAKVGQGHNCWLGSTNASHRACADIVQGYIANWLGNASGAGRAIALTAPPLVNPGDSKNFPLTAQENGPSSFANTVHPLLRDNCAGCHADTSATPQAPLFANADVDAAYQAAKAKMDIDTPSNSRFVIRLRTEAHNCWSSSCVNDANDMQAAITAFSDAILPTEIVRGFR